jgi:hypothetical protein
MEKSEPLKTFVAARCYCLPDERTQLPVNAKAARKSSQAFPDAIMIIKHIPMHAARKSGFASLEHYLTDKQDKQERRATSG